MSKSENSSPQSAIGDAIRAKRDRKSSLGTLEEVEALEASLLADIENFDLDAAEQRARREYLANSGAGMADPTLVFPEIAPTGTATGPSGKAGESAPATAPLPLANPEAGGSLLDQLRQQAELRQREIHSALAEHTSSNEAIDQALKRLFFYLHELVQQLNILKPAVLRNYPLVDQAVLNRLAWQEGFADYRTQSQSAGALVELVTFSYRLTGRGALYIERDGPAVERLRSTLFDFGLPFTCKEYKNNRSYVERAEFEIRSEVSVSARWRADFAKGAIILETRNLERLGRAVYTIRPQVVDQALLDDFGHLVIGQANRFRELAKR